MSLLTDQDILKLLGKDIVIEPFSKDDGLTPVGYDFHIGDFVYSLEEGLLEPNDGFYTLPAESTIQILTRESLWVSGRIGGLFHSKVSLVSKGLSHIATTLDPNWYGPLLITLRNNNKTPFKIRDNAAFVTLVMFKVATPTKTPSGKPAFRRDILTNQLNDQSARYIDKVKSYINNPEVSAKFENAVKTANRPMFSKIADSMKRNFWRNLLKGAAYLAGYISIIFLLTMQLYWDGIKWVFHNIPYDSTILAAQIAAVLAIVTILIAYQIERK